jgi:hypothetical protein
MVLARIRAVVVLPTPLEPQNKNAWARCSFLMAFLSVFVIDCWPTTVSKVCGRYFRADTTYSLIIQRYRYFLKTAAEDINTLLNF